MTAFLKQEHEHPNLMAGPLENLLNSHGQNGFIHFYKQIHQVFLAEFLHIKFTSNKVKGLFFKNVLIF